MCRSCAVRAVPSERRSNRTDTLALRLVGRDRRILLERQRDVVESPEQAAADLGVDRERDAATGKPDLLAFEVDLTLACGRQRADVGFAEHHRQQPDLRAVAVEDVA